MRKCASKSWVGLFTAFLLCYAWTAGTAYAQQSKEDILKKIKELEEKKKSLTDQSQKNVSAKKEKGSIEEIIKRYETLLESCTKKSDRCADVLFTLAQLYYDEARDKYIKAREDYGDAMKKWEDNGSKGPEPTNPIPNYTKPMKMYLRLVKEYSDFRTIDEAYFQMGNIYLVMGDLDSAAWAMELVVKANPNGCRAAQAHFRLSDFAYMQRDFPKALKHLELCKPPECLSPDNLGMVQYRKGEINYNMGEFDKSVQLFFEYIEKCDKGEYPKQEFRQEAMEYMAIAFSDMPNGSEEAAKFFRRIGSKPYEDYVIYTIGMKNRVHGQTDDAIKSLQNALQRFPYYKDAPIAQQMLVECYIIKKDYEKANAAREKLVDNYDEKSQWYSKNTTQKAVIDQSRNEVRKALAAIPLYYHGIAQKNKDKAMYEKALARYNEFAKKFPEDKWHNYEFKYYMAEIYNTLGDYLKSAENFDYVAMADLSTFGPYKEEVDTLGMDQTEIEKQKKEEKTGPISISQEDAAYNAVVALMNARKKAMARDGLTDETAMTLNETKLLLDYIHRYQVKFAKSANAAEITYIGADVYYAAKMYDNASKDYKFIIDTYPDSKFAAKSMRMIANCYVSTGEFDLAMAKYKDLLKKTAQNTPEYAEIIELAAGAMFKKAESMKKANNVMGAADAFKAIATDYPKSKVAARGWLEAAICYEATNNFELAASTLQDLAAKFPSSELRENAFLRAADDFKKIEKWANAANVYQTAALTITKPDYAIPSLSYAAEAYSKVNDYDNAGKMFELAYERYPKDAKTPLALYNAGLIYEKGKLYEKAIRAYMVLTQNFPASEYSAEAFFSVGLCYEKMGKNVDMAAVFTDFARKYEGDKYKQVEALVKAGNAYFNLGDFKEAQKDYLLANEVYEKNKGHADMPVEAVAESYFKQGEILYKAFTDISLKGNKQQVQANLKLKEEALKNAAGPYAKSIELGVEEWTLRSTYKIGMGFVDFADAIEDQSIEGSTEQKIGAKIKILQGLQKYYESALKYFQKNIEWAYDQNITGEYVTKSMDMFMKVLFLRANTLEKVGIIIKTSPVPKDLSKEDKQSYMEVLEEKALEFMDKALPLYEQAINIAADMGIAESPWIAKIKERITEINPSSEALKKTITPRQPKAPPPEQEKPVTKKTEAGEKTVLAPTTSEAQAPAKKVYRDEQYQRNMKRIQNIVQMEIPLEDKIKQLKRIEIEAQRSQQEEEDKIQELKKQ
ncbi:MAG TPA: tetratricopeptide repeat protein [Chitinivibrionales bacterium]|nr:tetratricopeptide repeat protein [Chitinivibrionales bacterium]